MSLSKEKQAKEIGVLGVPVFAKIHGVKDSKAIIQVAENRAISVKQLQDVVKQINQRCEKEGWKSFNGTLLKPSTVTLYDVVKYIILPLTEKRRCSYVEIVAKGPQVPQYFVSHWWGEPVVDFLKCLQQHAVDHRLDLNSTFYWVCAYANNQWKIEEELGDKLEDSPFYKAMNIAKGTISILDKEGIVFKRIWCGYELYESLLHNDNDSYSWCVYTSDGETTVGLTEGNASAINDEHAGANWRTKWHREQKFPRKLLEDALGIDIEKAEASVDADKDKILKSIGEDIQKLNLSLKSRFAEAGIRLMLEDDNEKMRKLFLRAINEGGSSRLNLDFSGCEQFDEVKQEELRKNLDWNSLKRLTLNFNKLDFRSLSGAKRMVNNWLKLNKVVDLSLNENGLGDEGAKVLAAGLNSNTALERLSLDSNKIWADGAKALGKCLKSNSTIKRLSLSDNAIGDDGAIAIGESLGKNSTLKELLLSKVSVTANGAKCIAKNLKKNKSLTTFVVTNNTIGDEGAESLANTLQHNKSLTDLSLGENKVGDAGAIAFAKALAKNKSLSSLMLSGNNIDSKGGVAIGNVLAKNQTLQTIIMDGNYIGKQGAQAIGKALKQNKALKELGVTSNQIGDDGAIAIFKALEKNTTLNKLSVMANEIGVEGAKACCKALQMNKKSNLEHLRMVGNRSIDQSGKEAIKKAWGERWNLRL